MSKVLPKRIWQRILSPEEKIKFEFSLGKRYIAIARNFWIVLGIPLLFLYRIGIVFIITGFLWGWYLRRANNYAFTNKRVLVLKGWLSTNLISVDYSKITDVRIEEPFFERLFFKTGKLVINTAGTDLPEIQLINIENPYEVKKKLDSAR
ncbi:hypothetical protein AMJ50_02365 [Parcubacteria bacterium DG_74_3]|nr:MAG: hypothetical protein AMJ50_02365 [Parcubacteria bacterium DG_74_3]